MTPIAMPAANIRWVGERRISKPPSNPNKICQIISPTPAIPNKIIPTTAGPYPFGIPEKKEINQFFEKENGSVEIRQSVQMINPEYAMKPE